MVGGSLCRSVYSFSNKRLFKYHKVMCCLQKEALFSPRYYGILLPSELEKRLPVIRLVAEKNVVYSSSHVLCAARTGCFVNVVNLTAEL